MIAVLSRPPAASGKSIQNILIIRPGGIGDAVLLIPAIIALKNAYPHACISVLAEKRNSAIFSLCPEVDAIFNYDKPAEIFAVLRGTYDVVIDTEQWHRLSAVVARCLRATQSIGFATNERKKLFTHAIGYSHDAYEVRSFKELLTPLMGTVSANPDANFLMIPTDAARHATQMLESFSGKRVVALFPGGSIPERRWGSDRFHILAQLLMKRGYAVVVVGGDDDRESGAEITRNLGINAITLCGKSSLIETAAVLQEAAILISGDSGILHIGYGLGIKTVALFGPGIEIKWAPRGKNHVAINKNLSCSPCTKFGYTPHCKNDAACMKQISAAEVYSAAITLLEGY